MHKNTPNKCHIFALGFLIDIMHYEFPILCIKNALLCITLCIIPMANFFGRVGLRCQVLEIVYTQIQSDV